MLRDLPTAERAALLARWHRPHRAAVAAQVAASIEARGAAVHIAVHSFVAELGGIPRGTDVGLLYDPRHGREAPFARAWQRALRRRAGLRVRRNYPYRGVDDGLPRSLRRCFGPAYLGIELELGQALLTPAVAAPASTTSAGESSQRFPAWLAEHLETTLQAVLATMSAPENGRGSGLTQGPPEPL